jgi:hypothetical protein
VIGYRESGCLASALYLALIKAAMIDLIYQKRCKEQQDDEGKEKNNTAITRKVKL